MKTFKRHRDYGFWDQDIRLGRLSHSGDPLEKLEKKNNIFSDFNANFVAIEKNNFQKYFFIFTKKRITFAVIIKCRVQKSNLHSQCVMCCFTSSLFACEGCLCA